MLDALVPPEGGTPCAELHARNSMLHELKVAARRLRGCFNLGKFSKPPHHIIGVGVMTDIGIAEPLQQVEFRIPIELGGSFNLLPAGYFIQDLILPFTAHIGAKGECDDTTFHKKKIG